MFMSTYDNNERYFLKRYSNYYSRDSVMELKASENGYQILFIYDELQTVAMNRDGYLAMKLNDNSRKGFTISELSRLVFEPEEYVKRCIETMKRFGAIEEIDGLLFIEDSLKSTNQTIGAERKQSQRQRSKCLDKCPPNCPPEERENNKDKINNKRDKKEKTKDEKIKNEEKDNIISSAIAEHSVSKVDIPYGKIIDYLNNKLGTHYKVETKKTRDLIKARFNDGFKLEDFIIVIDKKFEDWKNSEQAKYLRPETLFGNRFESYLNQMEVGSKRDEVMDTLEAIYDGRIRIE